ncbi:MAG: DUF4198 domain-containing protein [Hyphomonadaceae bacterium]
MRNFTRSALAAAALIAFTSPAHALTAFVLPQDFTPDEGPVAVQAGYASTFFTPSVGLEPSGFFALAPDGSRAPYAGARIEGNAAVVEFPMYSRGTFRISSGEVLGQPTQMVGVDGSWRALGAGETPPEGAPVSTLQTVTLAESFVTNGRPNDDVLDDRTGRLNLQPITHPNRISVADGFNVQLNFDGAAFPNMPLVLYAANDPDTDIETTFVTGADGRALVRFPGAGQYVIAIRHRGNAPAGAAAQVQSFTTTLTVEVFDTLPPLPEVEEESPRRRTRPARDPRSRL